jgi:hypothetical protein
VGILTDLFAGTEGDVERALAAVGGPREAGIATFEAKFVDTIKLATLLSLVRGLDAGALVRGDANS